MTATRNFLALDLGASSGRAVIGRFDGERLALEEVHRFANGPGAPADGRGLEHPLGQPRPVRPGQGGHREGGRVLREATGPWSAWASTPGAWTTGCWTRPASCWATRYHYRDTRTVGVLERVFEIVPREEVFRNTGIQFMDLNTLYQLFAARGTAALDKAQRLLFTPDLLNYWLSGRAVNEYTIATTSQCLEPFSRTWAYDLLERLGHPHAHLRRDRPARHGARPAAAVGGRGNRRGGHPAGRRRLPRHGVRGRGGPGRRARSARSSARAPGRSSAWKARCRWSTTPRSPSTSRTKAASATRSG